MFEICRHLIFDSKTFPHCCIRDINNANQYLHSDGNITKAAEYFETPADAQKILDKFYPKPKHFWRHGDVFKNISGMWLYLEPYPKPIVVCLDIPGCGGTLDCQLKHATFLFNIKEKI